MADEWCHAAVHRQLQRARGVCAGAVGRGRGDQPGEGWLHKFDETALWGLCVRGFVGACMHACVRSWLGSLGWRALENMGERYSRPSRTSGRWERCGYGLQQMCPCGGEAWHAGVMFRCECRVVLQTNGATPLYIASRKGHVECVRALLGEGVAINQAKVGSTSSMAQHRRGLCVWGSVGACVHACVCSWSGARGWRALEGLGERWCSPRRTSGHGEHRDNGLHQSVNAVVRPGMTA